jgi:ABC-type multidrug transport system fused ATPase/permease subunit
MLGGHDLRDFTLTSLRDQIAIVQQDAYMFNATIMDYIRIGKHGATNAEVIETAKKAYMHDFIIMLLQGYDTLLGEHGAKLSGGQRQLISIARASS